MRSSGTEAEHTGPGRGRHEARERSRRPRSMQAKRSNGRGWPQGRRGNGGGSRRDIRNVGKCREQATGELRPRGKDCVRKPDVEGGPYPSGRRRRTTFLNVGGESHAWPMER